MTTDPSSPGLGARLRASVHEPEDDAAAQLRARLRRKMFGIRLPKLPQPEAPAEPRFETPSIQWPVGVWLIPSVAVLALVGVLLWPTDRPAPEMPQPRPRTVVTPAPAGPPEVEPAVPNDGPRLLTAAQAVSDARTRGVEISLAVRAAWADAASPRRVSAALESASAKRDQGKPRDALLLLREVLDDVELRAPASPGRVQLLHAVAGLYTVLERPRAAEATNAEATRLDPTAAPR